MGESSTINTPLRIIHIVDSMKVGGAETVVAALCRIQRYNGDVPKVVCLFEGGSLADALVLEGIEVSVLKGNSFFQRRRLIGQELIRFGCDVVHCHNAGPTIIGAFAARSAKCPLVLSTRHGWVAPPLRWLQELKYWITVRLYCDRVVAVCSAAHRNLAQFPLADPKKIITIYNGAAQTPQFLGDSPRDRSVFTLVHVARMCAVKDQSTLLRAVAIAKRSIPGLRLLMVGDGPMRAHLEQLASQLSIQDCVSFLGERDDVEWCLAQADLFVLSSISEGLPISLLEAMAAGVPQVVTNIGGMPEVVGVSGGGSVVPPGCPETLAKTIVELSGDREKLQVWGRHSTRCYRERFTLERMAKDYADLYHSGVQAKPGSSMKQPLPERLETLTTQSR